MRNLKSLATIVGIGMAYWSAQTAFAQPVLQTVTFDEYPDGTLTETSTLFPSPISWAPQPYFAGAEEWINPNHTSDHLGEVQAPSDLRWYEQDGSHINVVSGYRVYSDLGYPPNGGFPPYGSMIQAIVIGKDGPRAVNVSFVDHGDSVPDTSSTLLLGGLACLSLVAFRRYASTSTAVA